MSNLILPQKWTSQPQTPVGIDWSNPITRGIISVQDASGVDHVTGMGTFTGSARVNKYSPMGRGVLFGADTLTFPLAPYSGTINDSLVWVGSRSLVDWAAYGTNNGLGLTANGSNLGIANEHASYTIPNTSWPTGIVVAIGVISGQFSGSLWLNGIKKSTSRYTTPAAQNVSRMSGASDVTGLLSIRYARQLNDSEVASLSANPWQIFKAQQRRIWVATTASGITGTVAVTNANDTSSASGTTTVTGSVTKSNANDTSAASGTTTITGALARTNVNDTSAASGTPTVIGTLATTNANDTSNASGSVGNSITGTVAYTNANDTLSASGTTTIVGTVSRTNANDTSTANGTTTVIGTVAKTNVNDTIAASGIVGTISGTVAYTNANDISTASGTVGSQASGSAPDYSVGKKKKFVVKVGDRLVVFSNQVDAINALPSEVKEPVKVKQYPAKKKSASANPSMANLQKTDSVPVAQPDETVPLQTVREMAQAYNAQAQYDQLMRKMQYEALYSLYQDLLEEDDSEALLMVA